MEEQKINQLAVKAKQRDYKSICQLLQVIEPYIDRTIRKLGFYPNIKKIKGWEYSELMAEAQFILFSRLLFRYDPYKGSFLRYVLRFLSKELFKKVYKRNEKMRKEITFSNLAQILGPDKDGIYRNPLETLRAFHKMDDEIKQIEFLIGLKRILKEMTPDEKEIFRDLLAYGRFSPVREKAKRMNLSSATIWRMRKSLKNKILRNL